MPTTTLVLRKITGPRAQVRESVILEFLKELPGNGKGEDASKYIYVAEDIPEKARILLKRPAYYNNGMDFTIHVDGWRFRQRGGNQDAPSHSDIVSDLKTKQSHDSTKYNSVKRTIADLYNCQEVDVTTLPDYSRCAGLTIEQVVLSIKWLFIEQDVTYWNTSGRKMFYEMLRSENLC